MESLNSEYLSTFEAAAYLKVSAQFLKVLRSRGNGPAYCQVGRAVRYSRNGLDEWMRANLRTKTREKPVNGAPPKPAKCGSATSTSARKRAH